MSVDWCEGCSDEKAESGTMLEWMCGRFQCCDAAPSHVTFNQDVCNVRTFLVLTVALQSRVAVGGQTHACTRYGRMSFGSLPNCGRRPSVSSNNRFVSASHGRQGTVGTASTLGRCAAGDGRASAQTAPVR